MGMRYPWVMGISLIVAAARRYDKHDMIEAWTQLIFIYIHTLLTGLLDEELTLSIKYYNTTNNNNNNNNNFELTKTAREYNNTVKQNCISAPHYVVNNY